MNSKLSIRILYSAQFYKVSNTLKLRHLWHKLQLGYSKPHTSLPTPYLSFSPPSQPLDTAYLAYCLVIKWLLPLFFHHTPCSSSYSFIFPEATWTQPNSISYLLRCDQCLSDNSDAWDGVLSNVPFNFRCNVSTPHDHHWRVGIPWILSYIYSKFTYTIIALSLIVTSLLTWGLIIFFFKKWFFKVCIEIWSG